MSRVFIKHEAYLASRVGDIEHRQVARCWNTRLPRAT